MRCKPVRKNFDQPINARGPEQWPTYCGVRGAHTKYLETFKVLGNQPRIVAIQHKYSQFTDMSSLRNAREISRVCANMY